MPLSVGYLCFDGQPDAHQLPPSGLLVGIVSCLGSLSPAVALIYRCSLVQRFGTFMIIIKSVSCRRNPLVGSKRVRGPASYHSFGLLCLVFQLTEHIHS